MSLHLLDAGLVEIYANIQIREKWDGKVYLYRDGRQVLYRDMRIQKIPVGCFSTSTVLFPNDASIVSVRQWIDTHLVKAPTQMSLF